MHIGRQLKVCLQKLVNSQPNVNQDVDQSINRDVNQVLIECQPRVVCGYQTTLLTLDGFRTHDLINTNWSA